MFQVIMIREVLFGLVVFLAAAFGETKEDCQGPVFKINGVNYVQELLKNIKYPESLSYDRSTNSLFMRHTDQADLFTVYGARMNLDNYHLETINGVENVGSVSVDAKTNNVYIKTSEGIYKYNKDLNRGESYVTTNFTLGRITRILFVKDDIVYFFVTPAWAVYTVANGEISIFKDLETTKPKSLFIDDSDNMFYTNNTGIYRQKLGSQEAVYYKNSKDLSFNGFASNKAGDVYFGSVSSGIFALSKTSNEMEKVLNVTALGFTFDGDDNIIYADFDKVYRLRASNGTECV